MQDREHLPKIVKTLTSGVRHTNEAPMISFAFSLKICLNYWSAFMFYRSVYLLTHCQHLLHNSRHQSHSSQSSQVLFKLSYQDPNVAAVSLRPPYSLFIMRNGKNHTHE